MTAPDGEPDVVTELIELAALREYAYERNRGNLRAWPPNVPPTQRQEYRRRARFVWLPMATRAVEAAEAMLPPVADATDDQNKSSAVT